MHPFTAVLIALALMLAFAGLFAVCAVIVGATKVEDGRDVETDR